jgi:hypothetical protein
MDELISLSKKSEFSIAYTGEKLEGKSYEIFYLAKIFFANTSIKFITLEQNENNIVLFKNSGKSKTSYQPKTQDSNNFLALKNLLEEYFFGEI